MQFVINALLLGGIYAAIGMAFSLIYGVMNVINLLHGALVMMGGYLTFALVSSYGLDPFLTVPLIMGFFFMVGYLKQKYIINRIMGSSIFMVMIHTYGLELIYVNLAIILWSVDYRSVTTSYSSANFVFGSAVVPYMRLGVFICSILLVLSLYLIINRTKTGQAIQATALNREAAQLVGVDIYQIWAITYGLASAYAAAAGSLVASVYAINPAVSNIYLNKAFVIAVLGGLGSMAGALVGGLVLAFAETFGAVIFGQRFLVMIGLVVFLIVVIFKPHGLVGRKFFAERK